MRFWRSLGNIVLGTIIAILIAGMILSVSMIGGLIAGESLRPILSSSDESSSDDLAQCIQQLSPIPPEPSWVRLQPPRMVERMYDKCVGYYLCDRQICSFYEIPDCDPFTTSSREDWQNFFVPEPGPEPITPLQDIPEERAF